MWRSLRQQNSRDVLRAGDNLVRSRWLLTVKEVPDCSKDAGEMMLKQGKQQDDETISPESAKGHQNGPLLTALKRSAMISLSSLNGQRF
jgi:hypothetical protein